MRFVKVVRILLTLVIVGSVCGNAESFLNVSWSLPDLQNKPASTCEREIQEMYINLRNMTLWAVEMWDASGRGPVGLLHGSPFQLGNFGQCLGEERAEPAGGLARQYCLATVILVRHVKKTPILPYQEFKFDPYGSAYDKIFYSGDRVRIKRNVIHWGICAPASCSANALTALLQQHFGDEAPALVLALAQAGAEGLTPEVSFEVSVANQTCQREVYEAKPLSNGALVCFWMFGISVGLVVLTSSYHWYLIRKERDNEAECPQIVLTYSVIRHLRELSRRPQAGDKLQVMWGLRFLSICFIILDHRFGTVISGPVSNKENLEEKYHTFTSVFICHSDLLVDSFLVLSGLLSVHGLLGRKDTFINLPLLVFYRYVRLVPAYAMVIFVTAQILPLTGSGPLWPVIMDIEGAYCRENWWTNLLMLSNYINVEQMCMVHSWYIPVDFHYFLVSVVVCVLFRIRSRLLPALTVLSLLTLAAVLTPALITFWMKLPGTLLYFDDFLTNPREHPVFKYIYIGSHTRAGPYLIGMISGYLIVRYHKPGTKIISTPLSVIGALVALGGLLAAMASGTVFYEPSRPYSVVEASFYAALHRPVWAAALCLLINCCVFGHVPLISILLSWHPWVPLGKLVYGAYLVHMSLQIRAVAMTRQPYHLDPLIILGQALGDMVMSFSASLVLYLTVEGPVRQVINLIIFPKKKDRSLPVSEETVSQTGYNNKGNDVELDAQEYPVTKAKDNEIRGVFVKNANINEDNRKNHFSEIKSHL